MRWALTHPHPAPLGAAAISRSSRRTSICTPRLATAWTSDVQAVANRGVQIDVRLLDREIAAAPSGAGCGCVKAHRIWPCPDLGQIARSPIAFAYRLGQGE